MIQILSKEINGFLNSLIGYIVISVFLTGIGLLMWVFPETSVLEYGYADMETLFSLGPYVFMFLIPAITMRMFAEEKKAGTMELLLTKPLTDWQIILGKYLSGFILVVVALIPTLIYYFTIYQLGNPLGNVDTAGVIGSYIGLVALGAVFTSIGILSSLITTNQIVSFIIAVFLCFFIYTGFESLAAINVWSSSSLFIEQLGILYHYRAMSKGLIDTRNLIYFLSVLTFMLMLTKFILGSRRW
ncbi:gliding motility-associated ABC transporter permease subunit GldF [Fulvivirga lutea]|uniref:Gliding motility-associated ABC transporter permease subunit GldF n=1 Tax=Fulvivirga lutea TaxID=2810512 RepID=A0A975A126_9BACT|nr:gliding motility-associated ABC transporter permease subunit GldF [Fulvivirga lutea]QSE97077.1 gliding motility-associated ABC transporter permease subunit GldF [Fulvivirga lutea]